MIEYDAENKGVGCGYEKGQYSVLLPGYVDNNSLLTSYCVNFVNDN